LGTPSERKNKQNPAAILGMFRIKRMLRIGMKDKVQSHLRDRGCARHGTAPA